MSDETFFRDGKLKAYMFKIQGLDSDMLKATQNIG